jgi:hypothetical protein
VALPGLDDPRAEECGSLLAQLRGLLPGWQLLGVVTRPGIGQRAAGVRKQLDGFFNLSDLASSDGDGVAEALPIVLRRASTRALLIWGAKEAYDALPALVPDRGQLRVVALLDGRSVGRSFDETAWAASRYNTLIDAYVTTASAEAGRLVSSLYVSPTKVTPLSGASRPTRADAQALAALLAPHQNPVR